MEGSVPHTDTFATQGIWAAVARGQLCWGARCVQRPTGKCSQPLRGGLPLGLGSHSQGKRIPRFWGVKLTDPPKIRCQRGVEPAAEGGSTKQGWLEIESEPEKNA